MATKATKKKPFKGNVEKGEKFFHELARSLSPGDVSKKKDELYQCVAKRAELKERIRPEQLEIAALSKNVEVIRKAIKSKTETISVHCQEEINYKARKLQVRRLDTGKLVPELEEDMTDEDRNLDLLSPDKKPSLRKAKKGSGAAEQPAVMEDAPSVPFGGDDYAMDGESIGEALT